MEILNTKVLNGPNYWSINRKKLIVMKLDLGKYEDYPTNLLENFSIRLKKLMPTLIEHRCSEGKKGGFFFRLDLGTWLGHVVEHIALELQNLAGMNCGFGRTYSTQKKGIYQVIFTYEIKNAGIYAGRMAVKIADSLAANQDYLTFEEDFQQLKNIFAEESLGPSTKSIANEARKRNIPVFRVNDTSLLLLGHGCKQKKIWGSLSSHTSSIGVDLAGDKELTKQLLNLHHLPVPEGLIIGSPEELDTAIEKLGYPLVIKPFNGNHGRGVSTNINSKENAIFAFNLAQNISKKVIVERFILGEDFRFLVINYKLIAVAKRIPAHVVGTGFHSIKALIDKENQDPRRGEGHINFLTKITVNESTEAILQKNNLTLDSVLAKNKIVYLKDSANLSTGGTPVDVTSQVHSKNKKMAELVARLLNLDICGIDIITNDIQTPLNSQNGAIIEVNASPGLRMHLATQNVAEPIIDMLYPKPESSRIPIVAVTGTNGKTTVVRLLSHLIKRAGHHVGFTTTEGIYINDKLIHQGDCSGPVSAQTVLQNPCVDFAVLECARGGILREGLGFDECNISIITNISNDHLGLQDIHSLEELADVKAVVAESTAKEGYAILNADDDLVFEMKKGLKCNVALFGLNESRRIQQHCEEGGLAAYIQNKIIVIQKGEEKQYLGNITHMPSTLEGTSICMIKNLLPVALAGIISKFSVSEILKTFYNFVSDGKTNPGRMNVYDFENYKVIIDYAHNEGAYKDLKHYFTQFSSKKKIGIIAALGDRQITETQNLGFYAAEMFDEIVIRHNRDSRGKTNEELTAILMQGINRSQLKPKVTVISNEQKAMDYLLTDIEKDTVIFWSVEEVAVAHKYMKKIKKQIKTLNIDKDYHETKGENTYNWWR